jgi:cell division septum initiation protein DivIVA
MSTPVFKRSVRGYDVSEVDSLLADLVAKREALELELAESTRSVQRMTRELSEVKRNKPSFAELGSAFEETLRLAENQSEKMIQDGKNEADALLNQARIRVAELAESADRDASQIVYEAQAMSEDLKITNERDIALERQRIADERAKIETITARAERAASSMLGEAERQVAQSRTESQRAAQQLVDEANEILRITNEMKVNTEDRLQEELNEAQRSATSAHDEADRYAGQAHEQADRFVETAIERAADMTRDADLHLQSAHDRVNEILESAKSYADRILAQAIGRAREISTEAESLLDSYFTDAEGRIDETRRQKSALADFTHKQRLITNSLGGVKTNSLPNNAPQPVVVDVAEETE